tara:strand:+ start:1916 stop:2800 length:885 start_codon:yes stop_codon:yes gene_type:complete
MEIQNLKSIFNPLSSDADIVPIPNRKIDELELKNSSNTNEDENRLVQDDKVLKDILNSITSLSNGMNDALKNSKTSENISNIQNYFNNNNTENKSENITNNKVKSLLKEVSIINMTPEDKKSEKIESHQNKENTKRELNTDPRFMKQPQSNIKRINAKFMAEGGYVDKPTLAVVGEQGPELVTPLHDIKTKRIMKDTFSPQEKTIASIASDAASQNKTLKTNMEVESSRNRKYESKSPKVNTLNELNSLSALTSSQEGSQTSSTFIPNSGGRSSSFGRSLQHEIKIPDWRVYLG